MVLKDPKDILDLVLDVVLKEHKVTKEINQQDVQDLVDHKVPKEQILVLKDIMELIQDVALKDLKVTKVTNQQDIEALKEVEDHKEL